MNQTATRAGFIALIGAPNAGKSTLLNRLVGQKIAIVTPKVQTTRTRMLGIVLHAQTQLIFVDTPGIFTPRRRLDKAMVAAAWGGAQDADVVALLVDVSWRDPMGGEVAAILEGLKKSGRLAHLVLNKIDLLPREKLLAIIDSFNKTGLFDRVFLISALRGDGVDDLKQALAKAMPQGPWLYPEDQISDIPMRMMAAEITREKLFLQMQQELPYQVTVETESWESRPNGDVAIGQVIFVRNDRHKAMILGKGGQRIKQIGIQAREELSKLLEQRVHIKLFVKVRDNWQDDPERYRAMGLDFGM